MKTIARLSFCLLLLCVGPIACSQGGENPGPSIAGLDGKRVGLLEGSTDAAVLWSKLSGFTMLYFMTVNDLVNAVRSGSVDAIVFDIPTLAVIEAGNPGLMLIREKLQDANYALAVHKNNARLAEQVDVILRELNQDGTLKRLHAKWITGPEAERVLPQVPPGGNGVLRYGVADIGRPFVYQDAEGKLIGFDIELGMIIAHKLGLQFHPQEFVYAHLVQAVVNNLVDIAGTAISVTPEREQEVKFTTPYFRSGSAAMIRR
jgi:ABC-type amino acid transport/signal transduction systems, periplasmic component/domain